MTHPSHSKAAKSGTADDQRCRWPECGCYSPQGPGECRRAGIYANSEPSEAWNSANAHPPYEGKP